MRESLLHKSEIDAAIEAAIRKLPILPEQRGRVPEVARSLAMMVDVTGGGGKAPAHFRPANRETVDRQLSDLAGRAADLAVRLEEKRGAKRARQQLARLLRGLFEDTIDALAAAPAFTIDGQQVMLKLDYACRVLTDELENGEPISPKDLRIIAARAASARSLNPSGTNAGRPRLFHAQAVADLAGEAYFSLTGHAPAINRWSGDKPGGPFLTFIEDLFKALGVKAYGLTHADQAIQNRTRKRTVCTRQER